MIPITNKTFAFALQTLLKRGVGSFESLQAAMTNRSPVVRLQELGGRSVHKNWSKNSETELVVSGYF